MTITWWEKKKQNLEQRLLLWPRSRAHSVAVAQQREWLHCMRPNIVCCGLNSVRGKKMVFSRNRSSGSFSVLITSDVCWRRNIVIARFCRRNRFYGRRRPFIYVCVSNCRFERYFHRIASIEIETSVTGDRCCFDRFYSWYLSFFSIVNLCPRNPFASLQSKRSKSQKCSSFFLFHI